MLNPQLVDVQEESIHNVSEELVKTDSDKPAIVAERPLTVPSIKVVDEEKCPTKFNGISDPCLIACMNGALLRLTGYEKPPDLIPYRLQRVCKWTMKGKRSDFKLLRNSNVALLYTRVKSKSAEVMQICSQESSFHFTHGDFEAYLLSGDKCRSFSLRTQNRFGPEMMTIKYEQPPSGCGPRAARLFFANPPEGVSSVLESRPPKITSPGTWVLDLGGRIGTKSIKNCILLDPNGREVMSVMKQKNSELIIETYPKISELCVFALGVSSCLCGI
jgi:hypothetical protein